MIQPRFLNRWLLFAVLVGAIALCMDHDYYYTLLNFIGIHTLLVVGLNLLLGYAGQISLGHAAFFGLGAYTSGILTATCGIDPWLALVAGLGVSGTAAFLIGIPALKLRGYYLAMATLGFGIIVYIILNEAQGLTGGPSGLSGIPSLSLAGFAFNTPRRLYLLIWITVGIILALSANLVDSRTGRAIRALHDSEAGAESLGVDTFRMKLKIFVWSALYASLAGSLYAHTLNFIAPGVFRLHVFHQTGDHGGLGRHGQHLGLPPGSRSAHRTPRDAHGLSRFRSGHLRGHPHGGDDLSAPGPGPGHPGPLRIPAL